MSKTDFQLYRDAFGRLSLKDANGIEYADVLVVRAFPVSAPDEGVSIMDQDGHELLWLSGWSELPEPQRTVVSEALAQREFLPRLLRVLNVNSFVTPSIWHVQTDRGETKLELKGEEDIRRMGTGVLIVSDAHGVQYLIKDLEAMDKHSRKLLDRFL